MNTATHLIERRKDHKGRALFVVGYVAVYSEAEAIALTDEAVETLLCPLTLAAAATPCLFTEYKPDLSHLCPVRPE
jgi:hypothetical protein